MQKIELEDRIIYRSTKKGKKVRFVGTDRLYPEIVVRLDDPRKVEEVKE